MNPAAGSAAPLAPPHPRVAGLLQLFQHIALTRMQDVPLLNEALAVAAVGFEPDGARDDPGLVGVLVTPWFMNLLWLPLAAEGGTLAVGDSRSRVVGNQRFAFLGAHEDGFGRYEACSLFSPMFEFVDQAAALATAEEVLKALRAAPEPALQAPREVGPHTPSTVGVPNRRSLLFGRTAAEPRP